MEGKHLGEDIQESAGYMGCLDPEFPRTRKPIDISGEVSWQETSVWKLQSVVVEGLGLDEFTCKVVKGSEERHKEEKAAGNACRRGRGATTRDWEGTAKRQERNQQCTVSQKPKEEILKRTNPKCSKSQKGKGRQTQS